MCFSFVVSMKKTLENFQFLFYLLALKFNFISNCSLSVQHFNVFSPLLEIQYEHLFKQFFFSILIVGAFVFSNLKTHSLNQ